MPRPMNPVPKYRLHKQSGQAVVTIRQSDGRRRDVLLGKWNSAGSRKEHARILVGLANADGPTRPRGASDITANEVLVAFLAHADIHYRRTDGTVTHEAAEFRQSIRYVRELYGMEPAADFGPLALKAVRDAMIKAGLSRQVINMRIGRVKRVFAWAVGEEIIPAAKVDAMKHVAGLQRGRSGAKEVDRVKPVPEDVVQATLPHLPRHVAGLVRFQLATGCRPGEAILLRRCDLDTSAPIWQFIPAHHKLAHKDLVRVIPIGPKGQALLAEFPTGDPGEYVFNPAAGEEERNAARTAARRTPRWGSHMERNRTKRVRTPRRAASDRYTVSSYGRAVARGVALANRAGANPPLPPWSPNQVRHLYATMVRSRFGLEAAQVALGHSRADVTQIYAERNAALAAEVASKVG